MTKPAFPAQSQIDFISRAWNEVQELCLDKPVVMSITTVAFGALGLTMLSSAVFVAGTVPISLFGFASIGAASPFALAIIKNYGHLPFAFTPLSHTLSKDAYTPKSCAGGRLYYHDDVPVLHIKASSPHEAGMAQGYLTGPNIHEIWKRYIQVIIPFLSCNPSAYENLKRSAASMIISPIYRQEMEGIVKGYNRWLEEHKKENGLRYFCQPLTYQDVLLWQSITDLLKKEGTDAQLSSNVVAIHEKGKDLIIGRSLDMPSLSMLGRHFLMIRREITGQERSAVLTLPGTVGSFTGMNEHGVFTASNEAGSSFQAEGVPSSILQRQLLDRCRTAGDAKHRIGTLSPASSHLMTVADSRTAFSAQLGRYHNEHDLPKGGTLIATNHFTSVEGHPLPDGTNPDLSEWRKRLIESDLASLASLPAHQRLQATLRKVQNIDTTQALLAQPAKRQLSVRFANSYAAEGKLTTFTSRDLFRTG